MIFQKFLRNSFFAPLWVLSVFTLISNPAKAEEPVTLPPVRVEEDALSSVRETVKSKTIQERPHRDATEALTEIPGLTSSRMGGHGSELVLRGLQQNAINVISGDAYKHGGCPNRMDPPTAYIQISSQDDIQVLRGYQDVEYGFGGAGGGVIVRRNYWKTFGEMPRWSGWTSLLYDGNSALSGISARGEKTWGTQGEYLAGMQAGLKSSHNYKDGSGREVRSSFKDQQFAGVLGWSYSADAFSVLQIEKTQVQDALFEGALMDSPKSDNQNLNLRGEMKNGSWFKHLQWSLYRSDVEHAMDNYSLKSSLPSTLMKVDSISDTLGFKLVSRTPKNDLKWGIEYQDHHRDALRLSGTSTSNISTHQSYLWPDVKTQQAALFTEKMWGLSETSKFLTGLRVESVSNQAAAADHATGSTSPRIMYTSAYSDAPTLNRQETNLNAVLRYELHPETENLWHLSFARNQRNADSSERYMAMNASTANQRWIGNSNLKAETHQVFELGRQTQNETQTWRAILYYDLVENYIFRDTAKGQPGVKLTSGESIYRNIPVQMAGLELAAEKRIENWTLSGDINYLSAENKDQSIPLAQTPPVFGQLGAVYHFEQWQTGFLGRYAFKQDRVDMDATRGSGRDKQETPGWETLDIFARYSNSEKEGTDSGSRWQIAFGVKNLFNRNFVQHLNRADLASPSEVQVHEPGQSFYLQLQADL